MHHGTVARALKALWKGVEPYPVVAVLCEAAENDPSLEPVVEHALTQTGPGAATHLMEAVAGTVRVRAPRDRVTTMHALDALVRAGGDPRGVLDVAVGALSGPTLRSAAEVLVRAALWGWSLETVTEPLFDTDGSGEGCVQLEHARRLATLQQRGEHAAIRGLARVYRAMPVANLHPGVGVLEAQLADPERRELAADVLVALQEADGDMSDCWEALLPILEQSLRAGPDWERRDAAHTVAQVRYANKEPDARVGLQAPLRTLIQALVEVLPDERSRVADEAAGALSVLAERGADLSHADTALAHHAEDPRPAVRIACSRALSAWRVRAGAEAELPRGCSHRRVFAESDAPANDPPAHVECPACSEAAIVIFRAEDISQTHADIMVEARCPACGVYSEHHWGY
ncbi:MAG: hypothetical protein R3F61_02135 [Myxococcota bacterium]